MRTLNKQIRKSIPFVLFLIATILPMSAYADGPPEGPPGSDSGLSGNITLGFGWASSESQDAENRITDLNDNNGNSNNQAIPVIFGELKYTIEGPGTTFHIGNPMESDNPMGFVFGVTQPVESIGAFDLTLNYAKGEVYKNPYRLNVDRQDTDLTLMGLTMTWDEIMETGATASYSYQLVDVDEDVIGDINEDLQRSGVVHSFTGGYQFMLNQSNFITPSLTLTRGNMDGECESFSGVSAGASYVHMNQSFMFTANISTGTEHYDEENPYFNETREDSQYSVMGLFTKFAPFGFQDFNYSILAAYSVTNSNIDFYDSSGFITGVGIGYSF